MKLLTKLPCPKCKKNIPADSQFCSYCSTEVISIKEWLMRLADMVIESSDVSDYKELVKDFGIKGGVTEGMRIEKLIWRMFTVNLVMQEKYNKSTAKQYNDIFYSAVAEKTFKSKVGIDNFFKLIKTRNDHYYWAIKRTDDGAAIGWGMDFLCFFLYGDLSMDKLPDNGKVTLASLAILEEYVKFKKFVEEEYFS
jgi:endogenous inhibitor of DNA gyrase (YacG/DUF329 family)